MQNITLDKKIITDIIQWDINTWSKALYYWESKIDFKNINNALELGSKKGGLSLYLALKGIKTICSDYENCQSLAFPLHNSYNLTSLISYEIIDATNIPYKNYFDLIIFKSILGGIGRNNNFDKIVLTMNNIYDALKPGGVLLFAENLTATSFHMFLRKKFTPWSNYWRYLTFDELNLLFKKFSKYEFETNGFLAVLGKSEKERQILSTLDDLLFNKIISNKNKYVAYGYAIK